MRGSSKNIVAYASIKPTHSTIFSIDQGRFEGNYTVPDQKFQLPFAPGAFSPATNSNNTSWTLSEKSAKRIKNSINWLVLYSRKKSVKSSRSGKSISFRINFITLTLPIMQKHLDTTIKKKCLNGFLTQLRDRYGLRNYVWRAECQKNGSIHFHIVTDQYLNAFAIRRLWNKKLELLGYISAYSAKFKNLSRSEYINLYDHGTKTDRKTLDKRYTYGLQTDWQNPNTTDIHSVAKIRSLAAYISKYMAKSALHCDRTVLRSTQNRKISGRLWNLSQSLSKLKGITDIYCDQIRLVIDRAIDSKRFKIIREQYYTVVCCTISQLLSLSKEFMRKTLRDYALEVGYQATAPPARGYYIEKVLTF